MRIIYLFLVLFLMACEQSPISKEVKIDGNKFMLNEKPIWFNGINTPWHNFNDFGGEFNRSWWEQEFDRYVENDINLARVWIHCEGKNSPEITDEGLVTGASIQFWNDMDALLEIAIEHKIYLLPAIWSFDMTQEKYPTHEKYRKLLASEENLQSYIDYFLIPLVNRYNDVDYLLAWEICNEPEWMFDNPDKGNFTVEQVQRFHAMFAAAIHKNSTKPVTTGSAAVKWNSPALDSLEGNAGHLWSDAALQAVYPDTAAYFDFYQIHWYPWQTRWMSAPYLTSTKEYGIDDKPVLIGETQGRDQCDEFLCQTLVEMYENAYQLGYSGVCAWKTPQNDGARYF
jgi:hypothetical protein